MNTAIVREYIQLRTRKDALDAELKDVNPKVEALAARVLEDMADDGVTQIKIDGLTISRRKTLWGSAPDMEDGEKNYDLMFTALLASPDTAGLVKSNVNAQSLSSFLKELPVDKATDLPILPEHLKDAIKVTKRYGISILGLKAKAAKDAAPE